MRVISAKVGPSPSPQHLLFYLDAANPKCFVPGNSTAKDLIGNKTIRFLSGVQYENDGIPCFNVSASIVFSSCIGYPYFDAVQDVKSVSIWFYAEKSKNYHILDYVGENFYINGEPFTISTPELITSGNFDSGLSGWTPVLNTVTPPTASFTWINDVSPDGSVGYAKFTIGIGTGTSDIVYTSCNSTEETTHLVSFWKKSNTKIDNSNTVSLYFYNSLGSTANYVPIENSEYKKESILYNSWFPLEQFHFIRRGSSSSFPGKFIDFDNVSVKQFDIGKLNQWVHFVTTSDYLIQYIKDIGAALIPTNTKDAFIGKIAKVAMWDKKLSAEEVKKLYNIEKTRFGL